MKLKIYWLISLFIIALWPEFGVRAQSNPIKVIEIADINIPDMPGYFVSAKVVDNDSYVVSLYSVENPTLKEEFKVSPFTENNFRDMFGLSLIRLGSKIKDLDIEKYNVFQSLVEKYAADNYIRLFYQLKVSDITSSSLALRPVAGYLHLSKNVVVRKSILDYYYEKIYENDRNVYIKQKWEKISTNNKGKIPKKIRQSLEKAFEQENIIKSDILFDSLSHLWKRLKSEGDAIALRNSYREFSQGIEYLEEQLDSAIAERDSLIKLIEYISLEEDETLFDSTEIENLKKRILELTLNIYHNENSIKDTELDENQIERIRIENKLLPSLAKRRSFDMNVDKIEIEFNEGFIENIQVIGSISMLRDNEISSDFLEGKGSIISKYINPEPRVLIFENTYPIGFSRKRDFENLNSVKLISKTEHTGERFELFFGDLLNFYQPVHEVGRRDFSPENRVIRFSPLSNDRKNNSIELFKEETSKLFEARVFSDFVGLDDKAANGLLQTEVAKRLNINTKRPFAKNYYILSFFGYLSWIEPTITLSKIEQNNRNLLLNTPAPSDATNRDRYYASTLDIRRHESFSVGTRLNAFYFDFPQIKSTFSFNGSIYYGRTPTKLDTIISGINTLTISPEISCDIRADERWGISLSSRWNYMKIKSREVVQVSDLLDPDNVLVNKVKNNWYTTAQFQAFFQPSEDNRGRLFFRYRYHGQFGDPNIGFHQIQLGYSFYLLGRNKGTVKENQ